MSRSQSRGTNIDLEQCVEISGGNRFDLVVMASARARELSQLNHHSERQEHRHTPVTALLDIQEGKVGREYLRKVK
jgi:DNA-directed RNA polymerase omega subunit